jgi:hypothetical protein
MHSMHPSLVIVVVVGHRRGFGMGCILVWGHRGGLGMGHIHQGAHPLAIIMAFALTFWHDETYFAQPHLHSHFGMMRHPSTSQ